MKPRIVLATDSGHPSGLGEHMLTLGTHLSDEFEVILAMPDHASGSTLLRRAAKRGLAIKALNFDDPQRLREWIASSKADLFHVHAGIGWEGHDLARYAKAAGLPVVRTEHLPYLLTNPVQQAAYRAMLLNVDARIGVSSAVYDSHRDRGNGRLAIVPNGIDLNASDATRAMTRQALGLTDSDIMLLTVARFATQKGHSVLVDAAPMVLHRFPDAKFAFVGSGPDEPIVREQIDRHGLQQQFLLLGHRDDVPGLLSAADLVVLPSLFEGLSLALLEAMAAQVPIVATSIGGLVEGLGADYPFLAPPQDTAAIADQIIACLSYPTDAQSAAKAAHLRFTERFTAQRMASETAKIYMSVLRQQVLQGSNS